MGWHERPRTKEEAIQTGKPVYTRPRDIPDGCFAETTWKLKGFVLLKDAEPEGYRIHGKYISPLFAAHSVRMKEVPKPRTGRPPPRLRKHKTGRYCVEYRKRYKYFGRNPAEAERQYEDWLRDVWSRDQMGVAPRGAEKQNLWNIPNQLAWLANELREYVAWTYPPCVYFFLRKGEITYVGSTNALPSRIRQHLEEGRKFDRVLWMPVEEDRRLELEDQMIRRLRPAENVRSKGL